MRLTILLIPFLSFLLFGCVDVKIKSEIPKKTYYDLDIGELEDQSCVTSKSIGLLGINSLSFFDNKNIIKKDSDGKTTLIENILWVDNPKEMLKNILLKNALRKCIELENGTLKKQEKFLALNLIFLGFHDQSSLVEIAYKITNEKLQTIKMGTIRKQKNGTEIKDLQQLIQEATNEILSFF